jgi:hypothetical protein
MTADSDDVSEGANQKPKGALRPEEIATRYAADAIAHARAGADRYKTGEAQAAMNLANDPPA